MTRPHKTEQERLVRQIEYRRFVIDVMNLMDEDEDDAEADAEWKQLRSNNPKHFKVAVFHAGAMLHLQEANAIEAGEAEGDETPARLRHLAADSFAYAWGFAEELGDDALINEVMKDVKADGELYEDTMAHIKGVRQYVETMQRIDALEAGN